MPKYIITSPDGDEFEVTAPDGASEDDVLSYARANFDTAASGSPKSEPPISPDEQVASEREGGGVVQRINDGIRRFADNLPVVGGLTDEINAGINSGFGLTGDYDQEVALERARKRAAAAAAEDTTELGVIPEAVPFIGGETVNTGDLEEAAGFISGAVAAPVANVARLGGVGNAALTGAGYGAAEGFAAGEGASDSAQQAALGGVVGGAAGGVLGKLTGGRKPAGKFERITDASETAGVEVPTIMTTSDSLAGRGARMAARKMAEVPFVGAPLMNSISSLPRRFSEKADELAGRVASGASTNPAVTGEIATEGLKHWITGTSRDYMHKIYSGVSKSIPRTMRGHMASTRLKVRDLVKSDYDAASEINRPAIDLVSDALNRVDGLSYEGLLQLRTNVGAKLDDAVMAGAGTAKPALKQIYGSLTDDLIALTKNAGPRAARAWKAANDEFKIENAKRKAVVKLVGRDAARSGEAVVDRLITMAGTKSTADINTLLKIRTVMGPEAWDGVAGSAIHRLGRATDNNWSFNQFATHYSGLSTSGKKALFRDKGVLEELDALHTLTKEFKNVERYGNPSGTGGVVSGLMLMLAGGGMVSNPMLAATGFTGGAMISHLMARKATIRPLRIAAQKVLEMGEGKTSKKIAKFALLSLARTISKETGQDERELADRLVNNMGANE